MPTDRVNTGTAELLLKLAGGRREETPQDYFSFPIGGAREVDIGDGATEQKRTQASHHSLDFGKFRHLRISFTALRSISAVTSIQRYHTSVERRTCARMSFGERLLPAQLQRSGGAPVFIQFFAGSPR